MATITIKIPPNPERVITLPDEKLTEIAALYGVSDNDLGGTKDIPKALSDHLVWIIKRPLLQAKERAAAKSADVSDLITEK